MTGKLRYIIFNTNMGWVGILGSDKGLLRTTLPQHSAREARRLLGNRVSHAVRPHNLFDGLMERFRVYLSGDEITFPDELDLSRATPFQRKVWEITKLIPYGETKSYAWVAEQVNKPRAAQAVGQALARNPLPIIIPCHRVVTTNGKLGGFSVGLEIKKRLLHLETSTMW